MLSIHKTSALLVAFVICAAAGVVHAAPIIPSEGLSRDWEDDAIKSFQSDFEKEVNWLDVDARVRAEEMESQRQRYLQNLDRDIVELTYKRQLENIRRWHTESVRAARKRLEEQKAEWHHASPPPNHLEDTKDADAYNQRLLQEELTNLLVNSRAREIHAYTSRTLQPRLGRSPEDAQEDFDKRMRAIVDANLAGDRNAHTRHEARTVRARRTRAKAQAQAPAQASAQEASEAETSAAPPSSAPHQFSLHSMGALGRRMGRLVTPMRKWATGLVGSFSRSGQKSLNSGQMERVLLES